jgi:hypothetical protein
MAPAASKAQRCSSSSPGEIRCLCIQKQWALKMFADQSKTWEIRNSVPDVIRAGDIVPITATGLNERNIDPRDGQSKPVFRIFGVATYIGSEDC